MAERDLPCWCSHHAGDNQKSSALEKQLVGGWTLASNVLDQDGKKSEPFGADAKGDRRVHQQQARRGRHHASRPAQVRPNNRTTGTPEENKATVAGSIAYFGTYDASDADKMLTMHIEGSTFPNWTGTDQKRTIELSGDQLKFINKNPSHGPGRPHRDVEARQGSSNDGGSQGGGAQ